MNYRLTRRRFGQLAIASTATAAIGYLANKTFAQTPNLDILGARPNPKAGRIGLQSLDVAIKQVQTLTTVSLEAGEKLIGFTSLTDGTRVLAISPVRAGKKENAPTRLVFVGGTSPKTLTVSGLKKQDRLESLLGTNDGSLYGLIIKKNGRPPVDLVDIDINTGDISQIDKIKLPRTERFSNLAQCPNGTFYTTAVGRRGETSLVQLDLGQGKPIVRAELEFNDRVWNSGFSDLVCSPAGQLFALGAPRYITPYNLYTVDTSTGAMTLLTEFDVTKIAIPRAT